MARNFAKEKTIMYRALLLCTLMLDVCIGTSVFSSTLPSEVNFSVLYSANVNGELESCG